jgi:hypothetical protein
VIEPREANCTKNGVMGNFDSLVFSPPFNWRKSPMRVFEPKPSGKLALACDHHSTIEIAVFELAL